MSDPTSSAEQPDATPQTPDEIAAEIAATRARLAENVDALSEKLDVKAQAKDKATDVKEKVLGAAGSATDSAVEGSRTLVQKFQAASRPVQAVVVALPLALLVTLIIRRARS
jgi:hypothetical protein